MNAKTFILLLILVAVACTNRSTSSGTRRNEALEQCPSTNQCLLENKARQTLDLANRPCPKSWNRQKNGTTDTLIYYARRYLMLCGNNYINTKQYKDGIDYMDSIGNHPHPRTLPARTAELQGRTEPTVWQ